MTLPLRGRGLCLWAYISFTALQAQFIGKILGQIAHLPVLEDESQKQDVTQTKGKFLSLHGKL